MDDGLPVDVFEDASVEPDNNVVVDTTIGSLDEGPEEEVDIGRTVPDSSLAEDLVDLLEVPDEVLRADVASDEENE